MSSPSSRDWRLPRVETAPSPRLRVHDAFRAFSKFKGGANGRNEPPSARSRAVVHECCAVAAGGHSGSRAHRNTRLAPYMLLTLFEGFILEWLADPRGEVEKPGPRASAPKRRNVPTTGDVALKPRTHPACAVPYAVAS